MLIHNNERFIVNNEFSKDVESGLNDKQKHISPKFFYDKKGSKLFEEICKQPEYYLNRTESQILKNSVDEIFCHASGGACPSSILVSSSNCLVFGRTAKSLP